MTAGPITHCTGQRPAADPVNGQAVRCGMPAGHTGEHVGVTCAGAALWTDTTGATDVTATVATAGPELERQPERPRRVGRSLPDPDRIVPEWIADMRRRNLSPSTIKRRRSTVTRFETHLEPTPLLHANADDITDWLDSLTVATSSRRYYIADLASFYEWAQLRRVLTEAPTDHVVRPQCPRYLPHPIDDDDLAHAVANAQPRMRCILLLGALAGLRRSEIAHLRGHDVDLTQNLLWVRQGKGNRDRVVPLHPDLRAAILLLPRAGSGTVIATDEGRPYQPDTIGTAVVRYLRGIGITGESAHALRHWFATTTYRQTRDLRLVGDLLGHASVSTTAIYTKVVMADAQPAVAGLRIGRPDDGSPSDG